MISLKQLRYFAAVAKHNHFGKAAEACHVSQPALSMQIRELENGLGVKLLERRQQGIQLTQAGRDIWVRAQQILASVRDLDDYARHRDRVLVGALRLGVIPSLAPYILPPLLPLVREQYRDLDLRIRETQTETLVQELVDGDLDVVLLALPIEHPEVVTQGLFEDRFLLAAPKNWRANGFEKPMIPGAVDPYEPSKAKQRRPTPPRAQKKELLAKGEWLADDRLLLLEEGHCLRDQALAFCKLRQVDKFDTFGASSLSTIVQMVANGMGLTLLPEISLNVEARHGDIQVIRFEPPEPSRTVGLAWRASSPRATDFEALGAIIEAIAPVSQQQGCRA